jgi:hypothetical protein
MRTLTIIPENIDGEYRGAKYEDVVRASWCYLHGELEEKNGYDIFSLLKSELTPEEIDERWLSDKLGDGIYSCICFDKPCTFFRWSNGRRFCGLVVADSDIEFYNYAMKCYKKKSQSL